MVARYMFKKHNIQKDLLTAKCIVDIAYRSRNARSLVKNCDKIILNLEKIGGKLTEDIVNDTFDILGIDENGLRRIDRKLLRILKTSGCPLGLETLSDVMNMPKKDVKLDLEPYLLKKNLMMRKKAGRIITAKGISALGA